MTMSSKQRRIRASLMLLLMFHASGLSGLGATAYADYVPRVVTPPFNLALGISEKQAGKLHALVLEDLKARTGLLDVLAVPMVKIAYRPNASSLAEAKTALAQGQAALEEANLGEAERRLRRSLELLLSETAFADFELVKDAYLALAVAQFRQGEEKRASQSMTALLRLDPQFALGVRYPPVFAREFEKSRRQVESQRKGKLTIEGPEGASVFVDGAAIGRVPSVDATLALGTHYVRVEGSAGETFSQVIEVRAGENLVKVNFLGRQRPMAGPMVYDFLTEETKSQCAQYAKAAGADFLWIAVLLPQDSQWVLASAVYGASQQGFFPLTTVMFDPSLKGAQASVRQLGDELLALLDKPPAVVELPHKLSNAKRPTPVAKTEPVVSSPQPTRKVIVPVQPLPSDEGKVVLTPKSDPVAPQTSVLEPEVQPQLKSQGVPPWVWVVVGVGVVAAAGGAYWGYTESSRPVTGKVTAQW